MPKDSDAARTTLGHSAHRARTHSTTSAITEFDASCADASPGERAAEDADDAADDDDDDDEMCVVTVVGS